MNAHRRLAISASAAILSVGAAVTLVATTPQSVESLAQQTPTSPGAVWTLAASDVVGNEFATFEDPVGGRFGEAKGGVVDAGEVLIAKAGLTNQETGERQQSELIGFDATSGVVQWKAPTEGLDSCSSALIDNMLLCHNDTDLVTVDASDGDITRYPTGWQVLGIATDGTDIYVAEGEGDGYSVTVHRGTLDDLDARWSTTQENTYLVAMGPTEFIDFAGDVGVARFSSGTALLDLDTGEFRDSFSAPDCTRGQSERKDLTLILVGRNCSDLFEFQTDLVDSTGRIIASLEAEAYQRMLVDAPNQSNDPVILGGSVFEQSTGRELWTYEESLNGGDYAIIGDAVMSDYSPPRNLFTGEPVWAPDVEPLPGVPSAVHDGDAYVSDWTGIVVVDPATGERRASVPVEDLIGNTRGRSQDVALQETTVGVVVVNETKLNLL